MRSKLTQLMTSNGFRSLSFAGAPLTSSIQAIHVCTHFISLLRCALRTPSLCILTFVLVLIAAHRVNYLYFEKKKRSHDHYIKHRQRERERERERKWQNYKYTASNYSKEKPHPHRVDEATKQRIDALAICVRFIQKRSD